MIELVLFNPVSIQYYLNGSKPQYLIYQWLNALMTNIIMPELLDILLTLVHLLIIGFNLLAWAWPATRRAHLICVLITAACWFFLGIWFGIGYCPVTDWQWQIKEQLGEHNLPNSFIKYYADKITGLNFAPSIIDAITAICFIVAAVLSVYFNFICKSKRRTLI